jgi:hypothetical protein
MRRHLFLLPLLALPGLAFIPQGPADGFYLRGADGQPGGPVRYEVDEAEVISQNNLNTWFRAHFSTVEVANPVATILFVGGHRFDVQHAGGTVGATSGHVIDVGSVEGARAVAAFFGTRLHLREHPGYRLNTTFAAVKEAFEPGENATLRMTITNVGTTTVRFMVGGRNRGARDNSFAFSLIHNNRGVPDTGNPSHLGGLSSSHVLAPGEQFEREVDLSLWFDTTAPGLYHGTGSLSVRFVAGDRLDRGRAATLWEDVLAGEFMFQRAPR